MVPTNDHEDLHTTSTLDGFIEIEGQRWPATFKVWKSRSTLIAKLHHPLLERLQTSNNEKEEHYDRLS